MANMDVTDREGYERTTLSGSEQQIRRGSERGAAIYSVIAIVIGGLLCYAALTTISGWAQWLVFAVLLVFTVALAFAVGPNRAGAGRTETGIDAS
jgi:1,4-dihydroxy-2-naphthoate octaprenyltransferase